MITIGQLIDVCNAGHGIIDEICGGNATQTIDKLKLVLRDPAKAAQLHRKLCELELSIKTIRSHKVSVGVAS